MAAAGKSLFNKRSFALAKARFHAWWEGEAFDAAAALAAIEAAEAEKVANDVAGEDDLFDPPPYELPPRLAALELIWGEQRVRPGTEAAEAQMVAALTLPADGVLAVLGPGTVAPIAAFSAAHPGKIDIFEWREETVEALRYGVAKAGLEERVSVARIDLEAHVFGHDVFDGLLSTDDFAYCSFPPHLAQQLMKSLKPGACAVVDAYVGLPSSALATAFASSFAEPQIRAHGDLLQFFADVGLVLEADEDLTEEWLAMARAGFKALAERLESAGALNVLAAQELAWEAEAWRARMRLLQQRRLERRRLVVRKPTEPPG